ncbi:MAG: IS30 family transposase [Actinobacteria bacterium]|nr:IS30 family transposase [Actinomycetota bacterium]
MLASSRRVKKGPGRRPQSAKRQRFMELRARGWSVRAAAREVGVSRSSGTNWSRGYKTYRNGVEVGFVLPLDALAVRQISPRYLSEDERIEIADLGRSGLSLRAIASRLGRAPSTISRELRRNAPAGRAYHPFEAHRRATARRARHHPRRVDTNDQLGALVIEMLGRRWSPQQISRHLRLRFPDDPAMRLCQESIYQAVYQPNSRFLRPSRLAPHRRSPLRTGRDHRRAHQHRQHRRPRFQQPMLTIHDRPFPPIDRSQAGHWEGDLIIGDNHLSAIGTLVERQTRMLRLVHLARADSDSVHAALVTRMQDLPSALMRSITWDQGTEMARHLATADKLGAPVYFCDSRSPWQRGSNENTNGLLRDYFPKGVTLINHSPEHLLAVEEELNNRPRMVLQDRCPTELFTALLASESPSCCDVD